MVAHPNLRDKCSINVRRAGSRKTLNTMHACPLIGQCLDECAHTMNAVYIIVLSLEVYGTQLLSCATTPRRALQGGKVTTPTEWQMSHELRDARPHVLQLHINSTT